MLLPGRLARTTLGDLLGRLHRGRATGVLELRKVGSGARCALRFTNGLIDAIELSDEGAGLDLRALLERAFRRFEGADGTIRFLVGLEARRAMRACVPSRQAQAQGQPQASSSPSHGSGNLPLMPRDFLHGRRRARDLQASAGRPARNPGAGSSASTGNNAGSSARTSAPSDGAPSTGSAATTERVRAMRLLGIDSIDLPVIRRAFRLSAARVHPDRYPQASEAERRSLDARMRELSEAYHLLCA